MPAEIVERPVQLGAVPGHGRGQPIRLVVRTASCDWHEMIDCCADLPIGRVGHIRLPIRVIRKVPWQHARQYPKHGREDELLAGVTVDKAVPNEDLRGLPALLRQAYRVGAGQTVGEPAQPRGRGERCSAKSTLGGARRDQIIHSCLEFNLLIAHIATYVVQGALVEAAASLNRCL